MLKTQRVVLSTSSVQPFDSSNWICTLGAVENVVLGPLCADRAAGRPQPALIQLLI